MLKNPLAQRVVIMDKSIGFRQFYQSRHLFKISPQDQEQLKQLAQTVTGLNGYIVELTGYTDSQGNATMNTNLSEARAKAVIVFLIQQGNIPVRYIVAAGADGRIWSGVSKRDKGR